MTTINAVGVGLSGATGTGNFVGATSPTLITPTIGVATATSITFSPTTSGIVGTTTNDNASAGKVGEYISSQILIGSPVSLSNNTPGDITHINLTAGDWQLEGNIGVQFSGASTYFIAWISSTSATEPDFSLVAQQQYAGSSINIAMNAPSQRFSLSGNTTIYLSAQVGFSTGAANACGLIWARRMR